VVGVVLGRWWTLVAAAGLGVWIARSAELEVPGWYLGLWYAALSAVGIALGVLVRRRIAKPS
jgi:hypothetical protein